MFAKAVFKFFKFHTCTSLFIVHNLYNSTLQMHDSRSMMLMDRFGSMILAVDLPEVLWSSGQRGLQKPASASIGYAMPIRPNKAETAVHLPG